jgi:hypothetical protein
MSGIYIFYVGNCRGEQSQGYLAAKKFMKLLKKQKEVYNIKYEELPVDPKEGQTYFSFAPAVRVSFDLR